MQKPLVLIVDDSQTIRYQIGRSFEKDGEPLFELMEAEDGLKAIRWLSGRSAADLPDVIVLDRNMPNLTGDEFIKIAKGDELWKQIPILFLTTHGEIDEVVKGLSDLQADDYLPKPFDPEELLARVKALIRIKQAENEARKLSRELQASLELEQEAQRKIARLHKHVTDSIDTASLIQQALIPDDSAFDRFFTDYFTIWQPRDVVGGDIYLFEVLKNAEECLLMVIDCTGHGVPGAFVTMLVKAIAEQIMAGLAAHDTPVSPAAILGIFNGRMKHLLNQEDAQSKSNAGFDGGILHYRRNGKTATYAGAKIPLFSVRNGELEMIKGNRHSIGYKKSDPGYQFKDHIIDVSRDTRLYLTTDGYLDQNGGKKGFPFGRKKFQQLIEQNYHKSFADQKVAFLDGIQDYRGNEEKNDDMAMIGVHIDG
ncbi:MAG: response regulator [Proteobacteria bacterium]|nr:response regulator [Pseudomonadota bacterium]